jgi:hypothetical protein
MAWTFDRPFLILVITFAVYWLAGWVGVYLHTRQLHVDGNIFEDFKLVLGATLTLLGLIIGFTFSMAVSRYDQRKNLEEEEANAIGTEYARVEFFPPADAAKVKELLRRYLEQRMLFYTTSEQDNLRRIKDNTARLQAEMWIAVIGPASRNPTPVAAVVVSGMNDVLNSQGYTQAAWWNRIPIAAWMLLVLIGIFCNIMMGYVAQGRSRSVLLILPVALAISFFLISDIDSPGWGAIRVHPQNLENLADCLRSK